MVELELDVLKMPQILSPCNSRTSNASNSPEFEFCSFPQPNLHSADELFYGGVLLPLHQLHHHHSTSSDPPPPPPTPKEEEYAPQLDPNSTRTECESGPGPDISAAISHLSASGFTSSKRWKDIFKKSDKKCFSNNNDHVTYSNTTTTNNNDTEKGKEKVRKKEKRNLGIGGKKGVAPAELNINIWPFRRSRSAGNNGNRPRMSSTALTSRKVSSAPCSRSNSAGESKSKKWPNSPSRGGIYLGRTSPIWQLRRTGASAGAGGGQSSDVAGKSSEKGTRIDDHVPVRKIPATGAGAGGGQKGKILKLNVPMCIGYRSNLGCRSDENSAVSVASAVAGGGGGGSGWQSDGGGSMDGVRGSNFNIRSLFSKKVY